MAQSRKVALITGASQGIGAGLVRAFAAKGYRILANARRMEPSDDPDVISVAGDIADPAVADRLVAMGLDRFGRIDTLVNNAGIFVSKPFVDYDPSDLERVIATNLEGFFHVTQRALRSMLEQKSGHIVSITTSLVDHANSAVPAGLAALTKGGLDAVTRSLAIEYASRGIRVNAVSPGVVNTPMHPDATHAALASLHPMMRMAEIADVVGAVLYLEDASFVTGETLHVDGGQAAGH